MDMRTSILWLFIPITCLVIALVFTQHCERNIKSIRVIAPIMAFFVGIVINTIAMGNLPPHLSMVIFAMFLVSLPFQVLITFILAQLVISIFGKKAIPGKFWKAKKFFVPMFSIFIVLLVLLSVMTFLPTNAMMDRRAEAIISEADDFFESNRDFFALLSELQYRLVEHNYSSGEDIVLAFYVLNDESFSFHLRGLAITEEEREVIEKGLQNGGVIDSNTQRMFANVSADRIFVPFRRRQGVSVSFVSPMREVDAERLAQLEMQQIRQSHYELTELWGLSIQVPERHW